MQRYLLIIFGFILIDFSPVQAQLALRAGVVGTGGHATVSGNDLILRSTVGQTTVGVLGSAEGGHGAGFWFAFPVDDPSGVDVEDEPAGVPATFALEPNYPNPFNPSTTLAYALPEPAEVRLAVFDAYGRQVAQLVNRQQAAGRYTVPFDAGGLASGLYLYRIQAGTFEQTRMMLLVK